jgi:hypothetical protein
VNPRLQLKQNPQATLNGSTTLSPARIDRTAEPTSSTTPRFSWPKTVPGRALLLASYMCRSLPQIAALVIRMIASSGASSFGSDTFSTATVFFCLNTTAFIYKTLRVQRNS